MNKDKVEVATPDCFQCVHLKSIKGEKMELRCKKVTDGKEIGKCFEKKIGGSNGTRV